MAKRRTGLLAALLLSCAAASSAAPPAARDPYFGIHIHHADTSTAWPKPHFGAWRLWDAYVNWPHLQPAREEWDFSRLDHYVAFGKRFDVDLLLPLGMSPPWASARPNEKSSYQPGWAAEPARLEDWRRYVRTVAERYRGSIRHYDVWNEVNEKGFYTGTMDEMVRLTCEAYRIIHEVSPDNRLVSPSFVGSDSAIAQFETFLRRGGKACIDIVGYHFYAPKREPEDILGLISAVRKAMAWQGVGHLPLWNTEAGWWMENGDKTPEPGADRRWRRVRIDEGPAVVARSLILGRSAGLERFYWYAWDSEDYGLIEPSNGVLKPAGVALDTLIRWIRFTTPECSEAQGTWTCSLASQDKQVQRIMWSTTGHATPLPASLHERVVALEYLDGRRVQFGDKRPAGLSLGPEPVLVILGN